MHKANGEAHKLKPIGEKNCRQMKNGGERHRGMQSLQLPLRQLTNIKEQVSISLLSFLAQSLFVSTEQRCIQERTLGMEKITPYFSLIDGSVKFEKYGPDRKKVSVYPREVVPENPKKQEERILIYVYKIAGFSVRPCRYIDAIWIYVIPKSLALYRDSTHEDNSTNEFHSIGFCQFMQCWKQKSIFLCFSVSLLDARLVGSDGLMDMVELLEAI